MQGTHLFPDFLKLDAINCNDTAKSCYIHAKICKLKEQNVVATVIIGIEHVLWLDYWHYNTKTDHHHDTIVSLLQTYNQQLTDKTSLTFKKLPMPSISQVA